MRDVCIVDSENRFTDLVEHLYELERRFSDQMSTEEYLALQMAIRILYIEHGFSLHGKKATGNP
jgi:hypothetical protein